MKKYELIEHTADIGIRAYGADYKELFVNCARAMFEIIADLEGLKISVSVPVKLKAADFEGLLVSWLDELLYNCYTKGIIFCDFDIKELTSTNIVAAASGRHIGDNKNRLKAEIKAATFHDLKIKKDKDCYSVEIIFDV